MEAKFNPGQIVATPAAIEAMWNNHCPPESLLARHLAGDWGDCHVEDRISNDNALREELRLISVYTLADGQRIWLITEADRSSSTFLLPSEY